MDKINAGFHRIGIVAASIIALCATAYAGILFAGIGLSENGMALVFFAMGIALAGLAYCAARAMGWIIKGFAGR